MSCSCCGLCNCPCTNIVVTITGCTLLNGEYTLTPDTMYGAQCLYTLSTTVSGFTLSLKFNCRTNQFVFDWNGEHFADEVTIESADPFEASISGSIDCDGDTVTLFADLTCDGTNPVDCICCNFSDGDTIDVTFDSSCAALDGQVITLTYETSPTNRFYGEIIDFQLCGWNLTYSLECDAGIWSATINVNGIDYVADSTSFSCVGSGESSYTDVDFNNCDGCNLSNITATLSNLVSSASCLECCGYDLADHPANLTVTIIDSDCPGWIGLSNTIPFSTAMLWTGDIDTGCADPGDPSTITLNIRCAEGSVLWEWFEVDNNDVVQAEMVSCDPFTLRFTKTLLYAPCDCTWVQVEVTL